MNEGTKRVTSRDDAIKLVKKCRRAKKSIYIFVHQEAPIVDKPGRVFPIAATVKVSKKDAIKFLIAAYSDVLVGRGAQVSSTEMDNCLFIG